MENIVDIIDFVDSYSHNSLEQRKQKETQQQKQALESRITNVIQNYFTLVNNNRYAFIEPFDISYVFLYFVVYDDQLYYTNNNLAEKPVLIRDSNALISILGIPYPYSQYAPSFFGMLKEFISLAYSHTETFFSNGDFSINTINGILDSKMKTNTIKQNFDFFKTLLPYQIQYGIPGFLIPNVCPFISVDDTICLESNIPSTLTKEILMSGFVGSGLYPLPDTTMLFQILSKMNPLLNKRSSSSSDSFIFSYQFNSFVTSYFDAEFALNRKAPNSDLYKIPYSFDTNLDAALSDTSDMIDFLTVLTNSKTDTLNAFIDLAYSIVTNKPTKHLYIINVPESMNDFILNLLALLSGHFRNMTLYSRSDEIQFDYKDIIRLIDSKLYGIRTIVFMLDSANRTTYNKITTFAGGLNISKKSDIQKVTYINNATTVYINNAESIPKALTECCKTRKLESCCIDLDLDSCKTAEKLFIDTLSSYKKAKDNDIDYDTYREDEYAKDIFRGFEISYYKEANAFKENGSIPYEIDIKNHVLRQAWLLYKRPDFSKWMHLPLVLTIYKLGEDSSNQKEPAKTAAGSSDSDIIKGFLENFCKITSVDKDRIYKDDIYAYYEMYASANDEKAVGATTFAKSVHDIYGEKLKYKPWHSEESKNAQAFWGIVFDEEKCKCYLDEMKSQESATTENEFKEYIGSVFEKSGANLQPILDQLMDYVQNNPY